METSSRSLNFSVRIPTWAAAAVNRKPPGLLFVLLAADAVFIVFHLLYSFGLGLDSPAFWLGQDRGYGEIFQYLKLVSIAVLLAALARKNPAPVYFHWIGLFSYFFLDDALLFHEQAGKWLAGWLGLPAVFNAQGFHIGELLFFGLLGLLFLTTLALTYQKSDEAAKAVSQDLILLAAALAVFGVGLDLVHELVAWPWLRTALGTLEDGGELIIVSVIVWQVYGRAARGLGWRDRPQAWVQTAAVGVALFSLFAGLLSVVQFGTPALAGNDGYYHAKMGFLIRQQGLKPAPPQLPLTILNEGSFSNHHLLYHAYLALFAAVDPALDGGGGLTASVKVASVILPALAFLAVWWLLRQQEVRWPALWSVGLLGLSAAFLYRMSMPRAQAASLMVLVFGFHWLLKERYRLLLPLGFAYVWLFDGFPLLLVVAGVYFAATWISERRPVWPAVIYPAVGVLMGLVINPYFPENVIFLGRHLLPKVGELSTQVGSEWYPYALGDLIQNLGLTFALLLIALVLAVRGRRLENKAVLAALLLTVVFGVMVLRSRRFVEYFPPFVLIFAALSTGPWLEQWLSRSPGWRRWMAGGLALVLLAAMIFTLRAARMSMARSLPADQYAAAALWLKAYSEPGSRVFQTDWDDFPRLFFYDSGKEYTVGLDPTFMELQDPALFDEWVQLTRGEISPLSAAIRDHFEADYVFSDLEHEAFLGLAAGDPGLIEIYEDEYAVIFEVVDPAGD